ncbi:dTMP kinase [Mycoplasmoides pirum]|uniref:dTMP kinase n=1 Tax=Mycoplasmoides pirum TaxID=2122 RepID=UPI00055F4768|nr:dTMP kinase [Mycoplasmoides pirum]
MRKKGLFISFEGPDGSGKTSIIKIIEQKINEVFPNVNLMLIREPGGTLIGENIRKIILNQENTMSSVTEAYLFAASRAELFHPNSKAALHLNEGNLLLVDRFVDSSIVYQGVNGIPEKEIREINKWAIRDLCPNYTFFLMISPEKAIERINQKNRNRLDSVSLEFQNNIFVAYKELIKKLENAKDKKQIPIEIDASLNLDEVTNNVWVELSKIIKNYYN